MRPEPPDAQAWVWDPEGGTFTDRCTSCMFANVVCDHVPCRRSEREDETRVIFLPRTPEGFAKGAAMTMEGMLGGTA